MGRGKGGSEYSGGYQTYPKVMQCNKKSAWTNFLGTEELKQPLFDSEQISTNRWYNSCGEICIDIKTIDDALHLHSSRFNSDR